MSKIKVEKMVLCDDGYGTSLVPESVADGKGSGKKLSLEEACEAIRSEAIQLTGVSYVFHPDGKLIGRAKGNLTYTKK